MKDALIGILGTIVFFILGWIKEIVQGRPSLKVALKGGKLMYYRYLYLH